jgi:hypothetical protein
LRIRLRRFLMSDPMAGGTLAEIAPDLPIGGPLLAPHPGARVRRTPRRSGPRCRLKRVDCCKNAGEGFLPG